MFIYALSSFLISVILIPIVIKFCRKNDLYDTVNNRKVHKGSIPRLGSVGFVSAYTIVSIVFLFIYDPSSWARITPLVISGLIIFVFGLIDDVKELKGTAKFLVQSLAAIIMISSNFRFTNIFGIELGVFSYPLTFCWIIGVINSYNLIDGVDALCGGLSLMTFATMGLIYLKESIFVSTLCFILVGAIAGFLVYNKPKAKIFMGDGGSQFLGFLIAVLPLYVPNSIYEPNKLAMIALLASIPIFDTFAAMWRRTREHRSFFTADKAHLHHKLMNLGYKTPQILSLLYTIQLFLCFIVFISYFIGARRGALVLAAGFFAMILFFTIIHYTNRAVNLSKKPDFKNEIDEH